MNKSSAKLVFSQLSHHKLLQPWSLFHAFGHCGVLSPDLTWQSGKRGSLSTKHTAMVRFYAI